MTVFVNAADLVALSLLGLFVVLGLLIWAIGAVKRGVARWRRK